jgi:hypothetical protein
VVVVILQPFYLPYAGVFELVRMADVFVFYDDAQLTRQNWMTRNRIKTSSGLQWLVVPVIGPHDATVKTAKINEDPPWRHKHRMSIREAHAKSPHRDLVLDALSPYWEQPWSDLAALNIATFRRLCELMGVGAEFVRSSDMNMPGVSSQRVLDTCLALGATRYVSGPAARTYLDEPSFETAGIELCYHRFRHPTYSQQHGDFIPYLSVVDLLANEGPASGEIVRGCGSAIPVGDFDEQ